MPSRLIPNNPGVRIQTPEVVTPLLGSKDIKKPKNN